MFDLELHRIKYVFTFAKLFLKAVLKKLSVVFFLVFNKRIEYSHLLIISVKANHLA